MKIFAETERLILRELLPSDDKGMFELDSDKDVHKFLGNKPVESIEQSRDVIEFVRQQYITNGIGRWAVIEKNTNNFLGWAGLKLVKEETNNHSNFYDVGYRLIKRHWGKGFATESAIASLNYGFKTLQLETIYGAAESDHNASRKILEKIGLNYIETYDRKTTPTDWFKITRQNCIDKKIYL